MKEYLLKLDSEITGCHTCPLCNSGDEYSDDWFCEALHGERLEAKNKTGIRRGDCPLKEVQTHGDLKDWEKIKEIFSKYLPNVDDDTNALLCEIMTDIGMNAPTIIEASKGEDNGNS